MAKKKRFGGVFGVVFWVFNCLYLGAFFAFTGFVFLGNNFSGFPLSENGIPLHVVLMLYLLFLVPIASILFAYFTKLYKKPSSLMKLFCGFELPMIWLSLFRMIFIREITPALCFFILVALLGIIGLILSLLFPEVEARWKRLLLFLSQEAALVLSGYLALLVAFFIPIILAVVLRGFASLNNPYFFKNLFTSGGFTFVVMLFWLLFFLFIFGFLLVTPFVAFVSFWKSFRSLWDIHKKTFGATVHFCVFSGFGLVFLLISVAISLQGNGTSYVPLLEKIRTAPSFESQQALVVPFFEKEKNIKKQLVDDYLAPYRYIADSNMSVLAYGYSNLLNVPEVNAAIIQSVFNTFAQPFIYRGSFDAVTMAGKNYEDIFDASLQDAEGATIMKTLEAANIESQSLFATKLLGKYKPFVHLVSEEITATSGEDQQVARVRVDQVFENISGLDQEVYYEFSLPSDAVMTNLKLGLNLEYVATIAPKGAARNVYENQLSLSRDPALLEQAGPRQYRLRVFPVPSPVSLSVSLSPDFRQVMNPELYRQRVQFEYLTFVSSTGITLPQFSESRNIASDEKTLRNYSVNSKPVQYSAQLTSLPFTNTNCIFKASVTDLSTFEPLKSFALYFIPLPKTRPGCSQPMPTFPKQEIAGKRIALLLDASYSNRDMDWTAYFKKNPLIFSLVKNNQLDLFYFNSQTSKAIKALKEESFLGGSFKVHAFGTTNRFQAFQDVLGTENKEKYDGIFMFTDGSDFEREITSRDSEGNLLDEENLPSDVPLYVVHTDGKIPVYRENLSQAVLRSQGGVFVSPAEALEHFFIAQHYNKDGFKVVGSNSEGLWILEDIQDKKIPRNDGMVFQLDSTFTFPIQVASKELSTLASKEVINVMIAKNTESSTLESIHALAQSQYIVSPYSSMIALVNDLQREALERLSKEPDAFVANSRTDGQLQLGTPSGGFINLGATPEPEEWLLFMAAIFLVVYFYRKSILVFIINFRP